MKMLQVTSYGSKEAWKEPNISIHFNFMSDKKISGMPATTATYQIEYLSGV